MGRAVTWYWEPQPMLEFDQDPPVALTEYPVLHTYDVLIEYILVRQVNDEAAAHIIRPKIDPDGTAPGFSSYGATPNNTWWYIYWRGDEHDLWTVTTLVRTFGQYGPFYANEVEVELRIDTIGTNQQLDCRISYAIKKEI